MSCLDAFYIFAIIMIYMEAWRRQVEDSIG